MYNKLKRQNIFLMSFEHFLWVEVNQIAGSIFMNILNVERFTLLVD